MNVLPAIRSLALGMGFSVAMLASPFAQAHTNLVQSSPAANAVVASPEQIDLVFNEKLVPRASRLDLEQVHDGGATSPIKGLDTEIINDGKTLRAKPQHPLGAGSYRVHWRAVGADNHPRRGEFNFAVQ